MKAPIKLSIALASLGCIAAMTEHASAATAETTAPMPAKAASKGGKCASGKCGTEKKYEKANSNGSQGKLVRARDGKCGMSGEGHAVIETRAGKLAEGVCGQ